MSTTAGSRIMALHYAGVCATCKKPIGKGVRAYWDAETKAVHCLDHVAGAAPTPLVNPSPAPVADPSPGEVTPTPELDPGFAGASAQREYDRRSAPRRRFKERHPIIGSAVLALVPEEQSTKAWAHGAIGERAVAKRLDDLRDQGVIVLHDRRVPRSRANIDHIAVGPTGVYVIDAKYREGGRVEERIPGSIFKPGAPQLWVGGRNCTPLVAKMAGQLAVVMKALDGLPDVVGVPITPMLAFVNADWGWFPKALVIAGVHVVWPKEMARLVSRPGPLDQGAVERIAGRIGDVLKPA